MARRILVLHGPNLNLVTVQGRPLAALDAMLQAKATQRGIELKTLQSNWEGALLDALHQHAEWFDGAIVNPASLAPTAVSLAEALKMLGKPAVEVLLTASKSALKGVVLKQISGKGFDGYFEAFELLAPKASKAEREKTTKGNRGLPPKKVAVESDEIPEPAPTTPTRPVSMQKTIGRKSQPPPPDLAPQRKTLGPKKESTAPAGLTRAAVRQKIADRLAGKLTPSGLSTWARSQWQDVQRGAQVESGSRQVLEDVLQSLVLSAAMKSTDDQLIELMTQLSA